MRKKKTAVISGGLGGVGRAVGKKLSEDGFDVIVLFLTSPQGEAEAIMKSFTPGNHKAILCDIRDGRGVADAIGSVSREYGGIDACVHAAVDPILRKNILECDEAALRNQFATGVFGGFNFIAAAASSMRQESGGAIVGMLSAALSVGAPHARMAGYVVAKYALRGLLREFSLELLPLGITVNAIAPDFMDTGLHADVPEAVRAFIKERAVTGSIASPEDVARAVSFLCSEAGKQVNGKIFSFDAREVSDL